MHRVARLVYLTLLAVLALPVAEAASSDRNQKAAVIEAFVAAFNAHDPEAMATFVTNDIAWRSIAGNVVSTDAQGKAALLAAMADYFESCPSCRSSISGFAATAERASVAEVASWTDRHGTARRQQSLAVYEFSGSLIRSVYYFPAEAVPEDDAQE